MTGGAVRVDTSASGAPHPSRAALRDPLGRATHHAGGAQAAAAALVERAEALLEAAFERVGADVLLSLSTVHSAF